MYLKNKLVPPPPPENLKQIALLARILRLRPALSWALLRIRKKTGPCVLVAFMNLAQAQQKLAKTGQQTVVTTFKIHTYIYKSNILIERFLAVFFLKIFVRQISLTFSRFIRKNFVFR